MRILIITHYYPPLNHVASSRPYSWAKTWSRAGHELHVLTTAKTRRDGSLNYTPAEAGKTKVAIKELVHWSYSNLRKHESHANILSKEDAQGSAPSTIPLLSRLAHLKSRLMPLPSLRLSWIRPAVKYADDLYRYWPYEVVISTFAPVASHIIASRLKKRHDIYWVADYRDLWTGYSYFSPRWPFSLASKSLEKYFLKRADLITTVSDPLKSQLIDLHKKPTITIENGFDPDEFPQREQRYFPNDNNLRLVYTGNLFRGKQDPSPLLDAVRRLKTSRTLGYERLQVLFFGSKVYGSKSDYLDCLIKQYDISDYVTACDFVDRQTSLQIHREANALLFFEWEDRNGILTGKLFEYMSSGTPIISVGASASNCASRMIRESGTGLVLNRSVENIVEVLAKLLRGEKLTYRPSGAFLTRYHRRNLAEKLLREIATRSRKEDPHGTASSTN